jgi:hypothetical protein
MNTSRMSSQQNQVFERLYEKLKSKRAGDTAIGPATPDAADNYLSISRVSSPLNSCCGTPSAARGRCARSAVTPDHPTASATALEIDWHEEADDSAAGPSNLVRHIASPSPDSRCPECNAVIYSRRHRHCGVCGEELPEALLFSPSQALQVEELLRFERKQHRAWMKRVESR